MDNFAEKGMWFFWTIDGKGVLDQHLSALSSLALSGTFLFWWAAVNKCANQHLTFYFIDCCIFYNTVINSKNMIFKIIVKCILFKLSYVSSLIKLLT